MAGCRKSRKKSPFAEAKMQEESFDKVSVPEETAAAARNRKEALRRERTLLAAKLAVLAAALLILFTCICGVCRYADAGMRPALQDGDLLLYTRLVQTPATDTVVLFDYEGRTLAGRVLAQAGDEVDITESGLYINGALLLEEDITQETTRFAEGADFPMTVAEGAVFVLGDNRTQATDSRIVGAIAVSDLRGRVFAVFRIRNL